MAAFARVAAEQPAGFDGDLEARLQQRERRRAIARHGENLRRDFPIEMIPAIRAKFHAGDVEADDLTEQGIDSFS